MFSQYIKLTGRGERGRRALTKTEAYDALSSYLRGDAELLQLAVLLMLQRVRGETPEEVAGYVEALREKIDIHWKQLNVDLDWPCYAGKKNQPPWLLLAAKVLAQQGIRILLHGFNGINSLKFQIEDACPLLNIPIVQTVKQAEKALQDHAICYVPLSAYCAELIPLLALRKKVGLRTPLNTVARALNPANASFSIRGVFHKGYDKLHASAGLLTGERNIFSFKGEGGESEVNPRVSFRVCGVQNKHYIEHEWPTYLPQVRGTDVAQISACSLQNVWFGDVVDQYANSAIICTIALILQQRSPNNTQEEILIFAKKMWQNRDRI